MNAPSAVRQMPRPVRPAVPGPLRSEAAIPLCFEASGDEPRAVEWLRTLIARAKAARANREKAA